MMSHDQFAATDSVHAGAVSPDTHLRVHANDVKSAAVSVAWRRVQPAGSSIVAEADDDTMKATIVSPSTTSGRVELTAAVAPVVVAGLAIGYTKLNSSAWTSEIVHDAEVPPLTDNPMMLDATVESNPADVAISASEVAAVPVMPVTDSL
jgi:hypothetical protein